MEFLDRRLATGHRWREVKTTQDAATASVRFEVKTGRGEYVDLGASYFTAEVRMNRQDIENGPQVNISPDHSIGPSILAIQSMFGNVSLSVNDIPVQDTINLLYPYATFVKNALWGVGNPSAEARRGWVSDCEMFILGDNARDSSTLEDTMSWEGSAASAATSMVTAVNAAADFAAFKALFVAQFANVIALSADEGQPGSYRRSLLTTNQYSYADLYVNVAFRPKVTLFDSDVAMMPDMSKLSVEFTANPNISACVIGDGRPVASSRSSGLRPSIAIKPDSWRWHVKTCSVSDTHQADIDSARFSEDYMLEWDFTRAIASQFDIAAGTETFDFTPFVGRKVAEVYAVCIVPKSCITRLPGQTTPTLDNTIEAIQTDPFTFVAATGKQAGAASIQLQIGGTFVPANPCRTNIEAYANFCDACRGGGFMYGARLPSLTKAQWELYPVYAFRSTGADPDSSTNVQAFITLEQPAAETLTVMAFGFGSSSMRCTPGNEITTSGF